MRFMPLTVREINRELTDDPAELIADAEASYYREIDALCARLVSNRACKILLLAGPTCSGKTTTAHILCDHLTAAGRKAQVVSLDDFYFEPDRMPLLANGEADIESVHALDLDAVQTCFAALCRDGVSEMPVYDFRRKTRAGKRQISAENGGVVIVEGLHALNPLISGSLPPANLFRLYISVTDKIFFSDGSLALSSRQMRLIRRISRDALYRGADIETTMRLWSGVVAGEETHLYRFKHTADHQFSTLIRYEPAVFRDTVLSMARSVSPQVPNYEYLAKTVHALEKFRSLDRSMVPENSLLREFIAEEEPE